ncbi:MAG: formate dehydrogenase accessory sulfurtransferase FdhD [Dermatophilaceae bacterium]
MARVTQRRRVSRYAVDAPPTAREDVLAVEEPLQIRVGSADALEGPAGPGGLDLAVTMRTPGHDFDLVAGFLVGEGIVGRPEDLVAMRYCAGTDEQGRQTYNVVEATLRRGIPLPVAAQRAVTTTSACGICGTTSIEQIRRASPPHAPDATTFELGMLLALPERLREKQSLFARTGGVHAAGLFDATGRLACLREDVGRHNAVDKVIGWALREGRLPLTGTVVQVSGRASFELVQKAHLAGIAVLAAVGAPSSLAAELADSVGLTLLGFSRGTSLNAYTHPQRVAAGPARAGAGD